MGPLSREQIQHYRGEGWLLIGRVLDDAELATLRGEEERFRLGDRGEQTSEIAFHQRAGEGVAFSGLTLHRSGPNHSDVARPSPFVRYCDPHVKMLSEGNRPVLEDPHSWMIAGEA